MSIDSAVKVFIAASLPLCQQIAAAIKRGDTAKREVLGSEYRALRLKHNLKLTAKGWVFIK